MNLTLSKLCLFIKIQPPFIIPAITTSHTTLTAGWLHCLTYTNHTRTRTHTHSYPEEEFFFLANPLAVEGRGGTASGSSQLTSTSFTSAGVPVELVFCPDKENVTEGG